MNIFTQLLKPFITQKRKQENIDFDAEPSVHGSDLQPVMYIKTSKPETAPISIANNINNINTPSTISYPFTENISYVISESSPPPTKIRKNSTSSSTNTSFASNRPLDRVTKSWSFMRQSGQVFPEEISIQKPLSIIKEVSESQGSNEILSRQNSPECLDFPIIHPSYILFNTLYNDTEDNLEDYNFHCINTSENLKPFIKKHNSLVDDINHINMYNDIISHSNSRSISCPNIVTTYDTTWKPPKKHGLQNSPCIIPNYYFQTHKNMRKLRGESMNTLLEIDYLFMIKDDIRNMRKLNQYQIDYIQSLDELTKNEIIEEFYKAFNMMIETITTMRSRGPSPSTSENNLLSRAAEVLESEKSFKIRQYIPRTSSI